MYDVPWRVICVGIVEHQFARPRVVVPASVGFDVHRAQLPLANRIVNARLEALLLLLLADLEPDLDEPGSVLDEELLDDRTEFKKALVLLGRAEAHDVFDPGAVVPAPVEDHDLAAGRKALDIALHVHLGLLPIGRRGQRHDAEDARADPLGDGLDRAALARRVTTFEHDDDPLAGSLDPVLKAAEILLKFAELLLVGLALHFLRAAFPRHSRLS